MSEIVIFSGTTEGRKLSAMLCEHGISHNVCVASEYGSAVMEKSEYARVHVGRMNEEEMKAYLSDNGFGPGDIVVDATHPYASLASDNIKSSADAIGCIFYKVLRTSSGDAINYVNQYGNIKDFARYVDKTDGNILLTTGSRDLSEYCTNVSKDTLGRTFVRIIPDAKSLEECIRCGMEPSHVIAMHGPFSYEMNRAVFAQYDIRHVLTKDSGDAGGFGEKIRAAEDLGISCHVLMRPCVTEEGDGIDAIFEKITGNKYKSKRTITLCGTGTGAGALMTGEVSRAIRAADALFGAAPVLERVCHEVFGNDRLVPKTYDMYRGEDIVKVLSENEGITSAAVLFSGDSGLFSGAKKCRKILKEWDEDAIITVLPGVSSVSYMAARLGVAYDDARIFSIHEDNGLHNINRLLHEIKYNSKTFSLISGTSDIRKIAKMLKTSGIPAKIVTGSNLSSQEERIEELTVDEAMSFEREGKITVLFINEAPAKRPVMPVLSDDAFIRDGIPMTKECVRHESIIRLGLCEGDLVYDIGGGTGSVALEMASLDPTIRVVTVEKDPKAVGLIRKNIEKLGIPNVSVVEGDAADVISDMECPDRVFIGGSGQRLSEIISLISQKGSGIRYVVNAVSLETMDEVRHIMDEKGATQRDALQISVSDIELVGRHHMLRAGNPVTIFSFNI